MRTQLTAIGCLLVLLIYLIGFVAYKAGFVNADDLVFTMGCSFTLLLVLVIGWIASDNREGNR